MTDAVTTRVVVQTASELVVHLTNISDGTGETNVVKVDKSAYVAADGAEPAALDIEVARWAMQGFTYVKLSWDAATDDTAVVLSGSGYEDFRSSDLDYVPGNAALKDPRSATHVGDLLLTTVGAVSGASYDITLVLRKASD